MRKSALGSAKNAYVRVARALAKPLTADGALPARDHRLRHWAASLPPVHDSLAIAELDVPWWTYRAIEVVEAWLRAHPHPVKVYEYGSGASTLWLARRADEIHSVEHHAEFGAMMADALQGQDHVHLRIIEPRPSSQVRIGSGKEGYAGQDFSAYVTSIEDAPGPFDVIVIDGRAREACLEASAPHLAPGGIIIFDNSRRSRYRDTIDRVGRHEQVLRGVTPTLPYPEQTSIITL